MNTHTSEPSPLSSDNASANLDTAPQNCSLVRRLGSVMLLLSFLGQIVIETSFDNIISAAMVALVSLLTLQTLVRPDILRIALLPSLSVLGFNLTTLSGALFAQTAYSLPLTYLLDAPLFTFAITGLFQLSLLFALWMFLQSRLLKGLSQGLNQRIISPLGLMRAPSETQLWAMAVLGMVGSFVAASGILKGDLSATDNAIARAFWALEFLLYAPYFAPLLRSMLPSTDTQRAVIRQITPLVLYTLFIVFIAIARGSRSIALIGITSLVLVVGLLWLIGQIRLSKKLPTYLFLATGAVVLTAPIFLDVSTAILIARSTRDVSTTSEMIDRTWEAFLNKQALEEHREFQQWSRFQSTYNETYIPNPFLNRFVVTKYIDNGMALEHARTGAYSDIMMDITQDRLIALLPTPVLRFFGSELDKKDLNFSGGDTLFFVETGAGLGEQKLGSVISYGMGLLGWSSLLWAIPFALLCFMSLQSLTLFNGHMVLVSPLVVLKAFVVLQLFSGDSVLNPISFVFRGLPQDVLMYSLAFFSTAFLTSLLPSTRSSPRRADAH